MSAGIYFARGPTLSQRITPNSCVSADAMLSERPLNRLCCFLIAALVLVVGQITVNAGPDVVVEPILSPMSLVRLREAALANEWPTRTFQLEGVVRAFNRRLGLLMLEDGSSTDLLELPSLPADLRPGDPVIIKAVNSPISRGLHAIRLGTAPLVEVDGTHPPLSASGSLFLEAGERPVRVEWFNNSGEVTLDLEYEREGMARQKVPVEALWHREAGEFALKPGLEYASYVPDSILMLPDFSTLEPKKRGVVPDFDVSVRVRPEKVAVVFSGLIRIPDTGRYTFHLTSDDGGRLFVTDTPVTCEIRKGSSGTSVAPESLVSALDPETIDRWVVFEGSVNYAAKVAGRLELELAGSSREFQTTVIDGEGLEAADLLHKRVQIVGLKRDSGIVAIDKRQLRILSDGRDQERVLTQVIEVRQLEREEASKSYRVEIQGVVTMANARSLVLQDATGGVFVHYRPPVPGNPPQPGELWKIEGRTGAGDFAPVAHADRASCLGTAPIPRAVQPTQQQLASGSLDAEMVEIEGVVIAISNSDIRLLTRGVRIRVVSDWLYSVPTTAMSADERAALVGSVVRLRGVYRATWDASTGRVQSGTVRLGNASMSVDEPISGAPFSAPLTRPSELLLFTSHPTALRRVRMKGQLLGLSLPELFLFDGASGFRVSVREGVDLHPGDEVEVEGFPQLGGPSTALLEARVRLTGKAPLPTANRISGQRLPGAGLDSTLVEVEGTLLSDTVRMDERALEIRSGSTRFVAWVPSEGSVPKDVEVGSVLRLTGVYVSASADRSLANADPFEIRIPGSGNVIVLESPPWWTQRRTIAVVGFLAIGLILAASWVSLLRRTVSKRTDELAVEIEEREVVERHRAMEQERSRMARDLHDELGSGLTEVGALGSLIGNPGVPDQKKDVYLEELQDLCGKLVTGLDEIVWAVNPHYDSAADLAGYFSLFAQRFLALSGIECRLRMDDAITKDAIESRMRHEIFLAFKEALNNIVRHSGATEVHLTIEVVSGCLSILIADNGGGFDPSLESVGSDGLRNMEERIRSLGGICKIEASPGKGTTIQFQIPLQAEPA